MSATPTEKPGAGATAEATPDAAPEVPPYLPVPEGVELTDQGSGLELGRSATVAWTPRRDVVGVLDIRVNRVERAAPEELAGFRLDAAQRRSSLFYVRGEVTNVGRTDLAGVPVPLYLVDGKDTLIQATSFAAPFEPCASDPMPTPFATGDKFRVCLVYLVPDRGRLQAVSFRPTQEYYPITWTGKVEQPGSTGQRR